MNKLMSLIRHNQAMAVAVVVCIVLTVWTLGCASTVPSIVDPDVKVTRAELETELKIESARLVRDAEVEVAQLQAQILDITSQTELDQEALSALKEQRTRQLDQMDALKTTAMEIGLVLAEGGTVNPVGVICTIAGILGVGAIADNRRKDGLIIDIQENARTRENVT
jgi:hypothetical protein